MSLSMTTAIGFCKLAKPLSMAAVVVYFKLAKPLSMITAFGDLNHCQTAARVCSNLFRFLLLFSPLSAEDDVIDELLAARVFVRACSVFSSHFLCSLLLKTTPLKTYLQLGFVRTCIVFSSYFLRSLLLKTTPLTTYLLAPNCRCLVCMHMSIFYFVIIP